jgi:hypothetical protein
VEQQRKTIAGNGVSGALLEQHLADIAVYQPPLPELRDCVEYIRGLPDVKFVLVLFPISQQVVFVTNQAFPSCYESDWPRLQIDLKEHIQLETLEFY